MSGRSSRSPAESPPLEPLLVRLSGALLLPPVLVLVPAPLLSGWVGRKLRDPAGSEPLAGSGEEAPDPRLVRAIAPSSLLVFRGREFAKGL